MNEKIKSKTSIPTDSNELENDADLTFRQQRKKWKREMKKFVDELREQAHSDLRAARDAGKLTADVFEDALPRLFLSWDTLDQFDDEGSYIMIRSSPEECLLDMFRSGTCKDWVFVKNREHEYIYANGIMVEDLGLLPSGIVGHTDNDFYDEISVRRLESLDEEVINGNSVSQVHTREVRGQPMTFLDVLLPWRDNEGALQFILGISREVTTYYNELVGVGEFRKREYSSNAMKTVISDCHKASRSDSIVLLQGETGVGKDHLARFIHDHSDRSKGPYLNLNCAALPKDLVESELFGYERGAFTGAIAAKPGRIEQADGGTLLLNEIGELPPEAQAKLLSFLDDKLVVRLGAKRPRSVNVRLMVATNRDLLEEVNEGRFRADLYYRIKQIVIRIPPLRDHLGDFPLLIKRIEQDLRKANPGIRLPYIDQSVLERFRKYSWPGNIRELKNLMRAMADLGEAELDRSLGSENVKSVREGTGPAPECDKDAGPTETEKWTWTTEFSPGRNYTEILEDLERALFEEALKRTGGNKAQAAKLLGTARETVSRKLDRMGIDRDDRSRDIKA
ncbi:sigma-54 interaction domain-containing protein [Desulfomonile tiedjei]|uniref:Transcriptional regulator containing GAF, AAA-type ATPase, and DNA binding domains n=1 Tax=Desulfomonile tiedjei (strain ATCC 49306 / DSM 6799 / DCB-1) TaxID=706587 RepID=I4C909_DESTA|nr:sigma-54-dependent Fis family transcriptional regulator [Desulfomonile tiedjei]AFM26050.1 transcriptional regulator containing GAF, AAA-type ATPase, and DNA binding domains [Desulfomonile tiedjei DSM 6799]